MDYFSIVAEIERRIMGKEHPVIHLRDRRQYRYLSILQKEFPAVEFFLTQPDLVIISLTESGRPPLITSSKFRFIQFLLSDLELTYRLDNIARTSPVLITHPDPSLIKEVKRLNFWLLSPEENPVLTEVNVNGKGYGHSRRQYPSRERFDILEEYLSTDLAELTLEYLTIREVLVREWGGPVEFNQLVLPILGEYLPEDLVELTLEYLPRREVLAEEWGGIIEFNRPVGIAVSPYGQVYVTDRGINEIKVFSSEGALLQRWRWMRKDEYGSPSGIAVAVHDLFHEYVYVIDSYNNTITVLDTKGKIITTWGGHGFDGLLFPQGIAVRSIGEGSEVYVSEGMNNRIRIFTPEGKFQYQIGGRGSGDEEEEGQFTDPSGLTISPTNELYVGDLKGNRIQVFSLGKDQKVDPLRQWEMTDVSPYERLGILNLAYAPWHHVYVVKPIKDEAYVYSPEGQFLRRWGDFIEPRGIAIAPWGEIYVVDSSTRRVQVFRYDYE
jgi:DNA-binding beta-propeller fold protein YncE